MTPEQLEALANRIDYEELWRRPGMKRDGMTQEQRDRLDAGVNLRRYARARGIVVEHMKQGAQYIRGAKLTRPDSHYGPDKRGCGTNDWHQSVSAYNAALHAAGQPWAGWMYTAIKVADEVSRMILLFEREREDALGDSYKMCAHDPRPATPLPDNHLRCMLGHECRKCPHLAAIDASERMTPEAKDEAKAWTCATHVLLESKLDTFFESFLRDKSDDAFDARLLESFFHGEGT